ncbi:MAG: glycosyltransferase [Lachnospiraceae bacterium]|jgi:rhamnosyltransferase|nr:glycosyltransferase [Lachnospiraceae bacterium]
MTIDILIPVYKPTKRLISLIEKLETQTIPFQNIILINTEEKYFQQLLYGTHFFEKHRKIQITHLSKREFNHGRTRRMAVEKSNADVFVMMTQDAVPVNDTLLESLIRHLSENVAVSYARQIPDASSSETEQFMRRFNYPEESMIKSKRDIPTLGIKTYFCSNVCAAYRRDIYEELGGFVRHTIFNEDMIYAAGAIQAGYRIAYEADACVNHSHDYTAMQQFHRNFDLGVSQANYPEVFAAFSSEGEGKKLVKQTVAHLRERKLRKHLLSFYVQCAYRYAGYWMGKHYRKLPKRIILACTMNKEYWNQEQRVRDVSKIDPTKGYGKSEMESRF